MKQISKSFYFQQLNAGGVAVTDTTYYPASASFIDVSGFESFAFLVSPGALDSALTFQVVENSANTSAAATSIGSALVIGATDDNRPGIVEVSTKKMVSGNHYVSLYATGGAGGNDYAEITFIGYNAHDVPVTQLNATGGVKTVVSVPG